MGTDLLSIGTSGLFTAKKSLQTAGHNVANVNTEGYSRQQTTQSNNSPIGDGNVIMGTGSYIKSVNRVHSDFIEKKLNSNISEHSFNTERNQLLSMMEEILNELNYEGLNSTVNKFFNSFRELSSNPDSETVRSIVRENAKILTKQFKKSRDDIMKSSSSIDTRLEESASDMNTLIEAISKLNVKIQEVENGSGETGDLRDQRDLHLRALSEFMDLDHYMDDAGRFIVNAVGVGTLVSGQVYNKISTSPVPEAETEFPTAKQILVGGKVFTDQIRSGKLGALIDTRKSELKEMLNKVDEVAWTVAHAVNTVHKKGFINKKVSVDEKGNPTLSDPYPVTNIEFFKIPKEIHRAAELIDLSDNIKQSLNNIVTAYTPNSPGDNRIAHTIANLQNENLSLTGKATIEEDYLETIGNIGLAANKTKIDLEQSEGILAQTKAIKERMSGVSVDEETANMVRYQHAYDASARVIRVADEMFKTVLAIKP